MEETPILEPIPLGNPLWKKPIQMKSTIFFNMYYASITRINT
jgi:hypothetical protein